jgi:hypothetical protein
VFWLSKNPQNICGFFESQFTFGKKDEKRENRSFFKPNKLIYILFLGFLQYFCG